MVAPLDDEVPSWRGATDGPPVIPLRAGALDHKPPRTARTESLPILLSTPTRPTLKLTSHARPVKLTYADDVHLVSHRNGMHPVLSLVPVAGGGRPATVITTDRHFRQAGFDVLPATRPRRTRKPRRS